MLSIGKEVSSSRYIGVVSVNPTEERLMSKVKKSAGSKATANIHLNYFGEYSVRVKTDGSREEAVRVVKALKKAGVKVTNETSEVFD